MNNICPISETKVNEKVARLNALFTVLILLLFIITRNYLLIIFLTIDFYLRGFYNPRNSILSITSIWLTSTFKIVPKEIDAAPKIFAAKIGFFFSAIIGILFIVKLKTASDIFSGILILCAALEGFFGYCIGCKVYSIKEKIFG
jgi:hypothetical protein